MCVYVFYESDVVKSFAAALELFSALRASAWLAAGASFAPSPPRGKPCWMVAASSAPTSRLASRKASWPAVSMAQKA